MYIEKRETGKCISLKKVLYLQYEIYSLLPLNKIVQRNSQHKEVHKVLHTKNY